MFMLTVTAPGLVNGAPKMTGFSPAPVVRVGFAVAVSGKGTETDAEGEGGGFGNDTFSPAAVSGTTYPDQVRVLNISQSVVKEER